MPSPDEERTEIRPDADAGLYPSLEIVSSPKGGGRFPLKAGKNSIGRSGDNDIVLDDSSVSRRHAVLELAEGGGATITDLGSRNGTKIQGRKIEGSTSLQHGTQFKIGLYQLRYLTQAAEPVQPEEIPVEVAPAAVEDLPPASTSPSLPPAPKSREKSRKWLLYLFLGAALIVALVVGGSPAMKFFGIGKKEGSHSAKGDKIREGTVGGVLPAEREAMTVPPQGAGPVFLDFSSTPIPAQIFFGDKQIGATPLRISTPLTTGKWYEAKGVFQLAEIGEVLEERQQFSPPEGATILPVNFAGKIGIFKISSLPRDSQLYLEGYFEKDPYRAKPIKFAEIVFGKPVYVPFGRYILELRKSRQLGDSQTYLDEVVYRREFYVNGLQTAYTVEVKEEDLTLFPVQITSVPAAAKVFIDEKEAGVTPYTGTFPVGEHRLTLKREGYFDFVQMIKMSINTPYVSEIQLKTSAAGELINRADLMIKEDRAAEALPILAEAFSKTPSPRETAQISYLTGIGYLRQKSYPEAEGYFLKAMDHADYKYAGRLGIASLTLEQGDSVKALQLLVEVLLSSEDPKVRSDAGALFQRISPLKSVMYITSEPPGARVFVNGSEVAQQTPLILHDLGVGTYTVQLRKEGYEMTETKLNIGVSEFRPVVVQLKKTGL